MQGHTDVKLLLMFQLLASTVTLTLFRLQLDVSQFTIPTSIFFSFFFFFSLDSSFHTFCLPLWYNVKWMVSKMKEMTSLQTRQNDQQRKISDKLLRKS